MRVALPAMHNSNSNNSRVLYALHLLRKAYLQTNGNYTWPLQCRRGSIFGLEQILRSKISWQ